MVKKTASDQIAKTKNAIVYTMKNPKIELTEDNQSVSITCSTSDIKKWIEGGIISRELGEFIIKDSSLKNTPRKSHKRELEDAKKLAEFIKLVVSNKEEFLRVLNQDGETFRQSREVIDNKLSREKEDECVSALSEPHEKIKQETIIKGWDLSSSEDRLIHTLSLLLSRKSEKYDQSSKNYYMGNHKRGEVSIENIEIETARILISPHELYSTYMGRGNYNSDHIRFVLGVLNDLSKKNFLITLNLPSQKSSAKNKRYDKFRTYVPVFQVAILNKDLTESESQEIDKNELLVDGGKCLFLFKFGPLFTNNIRDRYVEFPEDIHLRTSNTKAIGSRRRVPQYVNLMRDFLFREKQQKRFSISRDEETIVSLLGLSKDWKRGKKSHVLGKINKAFEVFEEIGLINSVKRVEGSRGQNKYEIELNKDFK